MARATGSTAQLLAKFESEYGTAPSENFERLNFVTSDIGAEQPLEEDDVLGLGRKPAKPSRGLITDSGAIAVPVDLRDIGFWLKALLGAPQTTGDPDYTHTFTGGASSLPSFACEVGHPNVPRYFLHTGCIAGSMQFNWAPSGRATATVNVTAQGETDAATSGGGTPTTRSFDRFHQFQGSISQGGSPLGNITGAQLTIDNGLDPVRTIRSDGKIDGIDLGVCTVTGQITARFADMTLMTAATNDTAIDIALAYTIGATKSLTMTLAEVYLPRAKAPLQGPGGVQVTFNFRAATPDVGEFLTVALKNDVASY